MGQRTFCEKQFYDMLRSVSPRPKARRLRVRGRRHPPRLGAPPATCSCRRPHRARRCHDRLSAPRATASRSDMLSKARLGPPHHATNGTHASLASTLPCGQPRLLKEGCSRRTLQLFEMKSGASTSEEAPR